MSCDFKKTKHRTEKKNNKLSACPENKNKI